MYKDGKPQHPLSRWDVVALVKSGNLVPPTEEEIRGWSQGDALSKTLAVVQTLWFVVQAIARRAEGLPITQLEIMTLAYATITVAMYIAWWDKPQNIGGPVRVAVKELPRSWSDRGRMWYERIYYFVGVFQDRLVDLRRESRIPTFYGGDTRHDDNTGYADVVALFAAMVFGAVHCAAWNYVSPSYVEERIWRVCSLAIVVLPGTMFILMLLVLTVCMGRAQAERIRPSLFPSSCSRTDSTGRGIGTCPLLYSPPRIISP
ncbi:hypothetical protein BV25DRAFT_1918217 [Artomyces pyxidatus]|uniref:Uncharacterized protein n=1 Tax=Artomyces pyxidatus TaxID=48021 RepID=A0ACB8SV70_9AGAM|nr:hypothetical protein BV25DRAFT_1918217 [Artomyces pyxidatus]